MTNCYSASCSSLARPSTSLLHPSASSGLLQTPSQSRPTPNSSYSPSFGLSILQFHRLPIVSYIGSAQFARFRLQLSRPSHRPMPAACTIGCSSPVVTLKFLSFFLIFWTQNAIKKQGGMSPLVTTHLVTLYLLLTFTVLYKPYTSSPDILTLSSVHNLRV